MVEHFSIFDQLLVVLVLALFAGFINSLHKQAYSLTEIISNCIIAVFSGIIVFLFSLESSLSLIKKFALAGLGALVGESVIYTLRKKADIITKAIFKE